MSSKPPRIVHMHIPKTAGTSVNEAFYKIYGKDGICPARYEPEFVDQNISDYSFFTGHIGFDLASALDANIVTVLRDPVDRFISVYYYWRQLHEGGRMEWGPRTAAAMSLEEFAGYFGENALIEEFFNRVTWQVAFSHHLVRRRELLGITRAELLVRAKENLSKCAVVGCLEDIPKFVSDCRDVLGIELDVGEKNVTKKRKSADEVPDDLRRKITQWMPLDMELYESYRS